MYPLGRHLFVHIQKPLKLLQLCRGLKTNSENSSLLLDGIRILDLTRIVAGPYCTMILGDMGADVIKIERPETGDECRNWGPPFISEPKESCYFVCLNRNKQSMCIDLKSGLGRDLIYELAAKCDILVENYVPGKLDSLQLGYDHIKKIAPRLIYCSITGFGCVGPYRTKPGLDVIASSVGGLLHITGTENEPSKPGVAVMDLACGLYAHGAILAALIKRSRTGVGQKIDCNILSTQIASLINIGSDYLNAGVEAKRWGTAHPSLVPYQAFVTKDGYYTIGAVSNDQFSDLCNRIKRPELPKNPLFLNNKDRVVNRRELIAILEIIFETKTNKEWENVFEDAQFPCGPINTLEEVFENPQVTALGLVQEFEHKVAGNVKVIGPPVVYSDGGNCIRLASPALGEHTDQVLRDILRYPEDKIQHLHQQKVVY